MAHSESARILLMLLSFSLACWVGKALLKELKNGLHRLPREGLTELLSP